MKMPGCHRLKNERGVALIIVLLITTLLIALVFEFAYGTRVSLRAAVNFRDSQRAYFLARSGVNYFKSNPSIREHLTQNRCDPIPIVGGGDTDVCMKWEDEAGKINISGLQVGSMVFQWLTELFRQKGVSQDILNTIAESGNRIQVLDELHRFMKDEDYDKVVPFLTLYSMPQNRININTASEEVLRSVLSTKTTISISQILSRRQDRPYTDADLTTDYNDVFTATSNAFKVTVFATAGGYTKRIDAIVGNKSPGYWKSL